MQYLLVLNHGSSSLKYAVFAVSDKKLGPQVLAGEAPLPEIIKKIKNYQIAYIGFRVVHGGGQYTNPVKIDQKFLNNIIKYNNLAPLHNPPTIKLINQVQKIWPHAKMVACFDTAWYSDLAPEAYLYALPLKYYKNYGIRKYGFHGLSHESVTIEAAKILNKKLNKLNIISCHLGAGASITWFKDGRVQDTTMGFSPNEGLMMAQRTGDLPPDVVLYLAERLKMSLDNIKDLINKKSGLLGLAGTPEMLKIWDSKSQVSKLAFNIYIYKAKKHLASYLGQNKKLDALVFTGKIGYNNKKIRQLILKDLALPKNTKILAIDSGEMQNIAAKTLQCLKNK